MFFKNIFFGLLLFCVATLGSNGHAADLTFTAEVDRTTLTMNDTLTLQLTFSGGRISIPQPSLSDIPGFRATFAGQSQNISYVNGQVTSQVIFSFALAPLSPGEHVIPSVSMTVGGQTLSTNPIPIKVITGSASPAPANSAGQQNQNNVAHGGRTLFVTTTVDKKTATVGEQITLLFRFYSRAPLLSQPNYRPPDTTGFMSEDLPPQRQYVTNVEGIRYQVVELATALFPTSSGKFTIGPASLECNVQDFRDPFGDGFFQNLFTRGQAVTLRSDPLAITVRSVPETGRPATFRGDVGRFQISASFDKKSAKVHDPLTLTVTVSGEGNVKALSQPPLPETKEFKTYETLSSLNVDKKDGRLRGSKVFTTVMKPEVSGDLTFPPLSLSFFDPQTKEFRTVSTKPLTLSVAPADPTAASGSGVSFTAVSEGLKEMGRDIRFIKTQGVVGPQKGPIQNRPWFPYVQLAPGLLFGAIWAGRLFASVGKNRFSPSAARKALRGIRRANAKGSPPQKPSTVSFWNIWPRRCGPTFKR
ncbi:MAG: protein BatD [Elusimicrobia bacterium]|nr:protein BatD [Elusimicrobiota bacterium]